MKRVRVLFLTQTTERGASARLRVYQFLPFLAAAGIDGAVRPLPFGDRYSNSRVIRGSIRLGQLAARILDVVRASRVDVVFLQRDLLAHAYPVVEAAIGCVNPKIILDIDDAIHLHPPGQEPAFPFRLVWDRDKLRRLVRIVRHTSAGNSVLQEDVRLLGGESTLIPTAIDCERWSYRAPRSASASVVIGWIGSPGTTSYLKTALPGIQAIATKRPVLLRTVGASPSLIAEWVSSSANLTIDTQPWTADAEVSAVQSFDVGVMPLSDDQWSQRKSATKLLQYMAAGVPAIASPVGVNKEIIAHGATGLLAGSDSEWEQSIDRLFCDDELRSRVSRQGRARVVAEYSVAAVAPRLAGMIRNVADSA